MRRWLHPTLGGALLLCGVLLGVMFGVGAMRWRVRRRIGRHRRMGRRGEARALKLLRRAGYRVLDTEVAASGRVRVDGNSVDYRVRADAIVRRRFRRYVAEFKGGAESAAITNRATRRQLLEYAFLFDVAGVILVDASRGRVHRIEFPRR
ncbi:MAG: hypothetical protein ABFS86_13775 [Planctomycetota bacterium]